MRPPILRDNRLLKFCDPVEATLHICAGQRRPLGLMQIKASASALPIRFQAGLNTANTRRRAMSIYGSMQDSQVNASYNSPSVIPQRAPVSTIHSKASTETDRLPQVALNEVYDLLRGQGRQHLAASPAR